MILGLVPARGGSKGIPRKNLALLAGRPMLDYTLDAALGAKSLDMIAVTTDDPAIEAAAKRRGVPVIRRPAALAGDRAPMISAVEHALKSVGAVGADVEAVVLLQPTSPLRTARHVDEAVSRWRKSGADSLISVNKVWQHPCECLQLAPGGLKPAVSLPCGAAGRQDMPKFVFLNGAVYVTRTSMLLRRGRFWDRRSAVYDMDPLAGLDIDEPYQLAVAEALLRQKSPALAEAR